MHAGAERLLLKDRAYEHIKGLIMDGTYGPGQFIPEREVAESLNISKTPIRSALERLAEQGIVDIAPQRGVMVRALTHREIADHYDLRAAVEGWIARHIAGRLSPQEASALQENLKWQRRILEEEPQRASWVAADTEFHLLMTSCSGNQEFVRLMQYQRDKLSRVVQSIVVREPAALKRSCEEHYAILQAVLEGNGDRAGVLIEEHLEHGKRFLLMGGVYGEQS